MNRHTIGNLLAAALLVVGNLTGQAQTAATVVATGTGRTTGHIVTLTVTNPGQQPLEYEVGPAFIPSNGKEQPYVVPAVIRQTIPPRSTARVPVLGYCADIHRPPVPDGIRMPPPATWTAAGELPELGTIQTSPDGAYRPRPTPARPAALVATYPGTDSPLPFALDMDAHPEQAAPLLVAAARAAETAYDQLAGEGRISTPFSSNPQREREAVIQQTVWIFAADLQGEPYTREDFAKRMQTQLEANTGKPLTAAPPPVKEQFDQGVDDFWNSFSLVGVEAKVLAVTPADSSEAPSPAGPVEASGQPD